MAKVVDYFLSPASPYAYMGGPRLLAIARAGGAEIRIKPINMGQIFPVTGGLPLPKRAPARQAYRLVELARWREHLGLPMNVEPKFFPVADLSAALLLVAARQSGGDALALSNAVMRAVWEQARDIADRATLRAVADEAGFDGAALLGRLEDPAVAAEYQANTDEALRLGVFGVPWCVYKGVPYWGQDRLDFLERALRD